ncbi:hypothetical protein O6H91_11G037200 [Diphasiastrum complanatum]|uniref:Uncharacterized protein n=4 Tax=Diphasiastrum complanatum TaxID=34168 RepID=A0ACC2C8I4_DIPCM|nr:hypothetical protein O6H91_11G037200 [Diphasiastrum complanatum]KAJ7538179.1 hypothetical protein O6H91_11G037200 [Diphasiastrum complanatum]KAJ7538180.1 hypothetical protein O6H91_11G037200 [Diphasiastrum complanatum]KAJ7538181.1 hypothetical protein O6H91_11G037200 [Diphasiastrum complanatum]
MTTESPMRMLSGGGMTGGIGALNDSLIAGGGSGLGSSTTREAQELNYLLRDRSRFENVLGSRNVSMSRSESAPPSVEGSLAAMGGLFTRHPTGPGDLSRVNKIGAGSDAADVFESEHELRSDPSYLAYYYSHINLNPRLPPPLISWENWRLAQRLQSGFPLGSAKDKRNLRSLDDSNSKSLFSSQSLLPTHKEEPEHFEELESLVRNSSGEWAEGGNDGLIGLSTGGFGPRPKSLVDLIQEDFPRTPSPIYNLSRPSSRAANEDGVDTSAVSDAQLAHLREMAAGFGSRSTTPVPGGVQVLNDHYDSSHSTMVASDFTSAAGLGSRSATPTPSTTQLFAGSSTTGPLLPNAKIRTSDLPLVSTRSVSPALLSLGEALANVHLGNTETKNGPYNAVSAAASAAELAALHGLNISDSQGTSLQEKREHMQQTLHEEVEQKKHQKNYQQHHRHPQSQLAQAQAQAAQSQAYSEALQQQLFSGLDQGYHGQVNFGVPNMTSQAQAAGANMYAAAAAAAAMSYIAAGNPYYQNLHTTPVYAPHYGLGAYSLNPAVLPPMLPGYPSPGGLPMAFDGAAAAAAAVAASMGARGTVPGGSTSVVGTGVDLQQFYKYAGQVGTGIPSTIQDAIYMQYMQRAAEDVRAAAALNDSTVMRGLAQGSHADSMDLQNAQTISYSPEQKSLYSRSGSLGVPLANKGGSVSPYYGSPPAVSLLLPYANSSVTSPVLPGSPVGPGSLPMKRDDRSLRLSSGASRAGTAGPAYSGWHPQRNTDSGDEIHASLLLEEFKNSKSRRFELGEITGHVVEFSADQHGSRFIQQKLETATSDEKSMVFEEVLPRALTLMTDVFGNYVIQKFFEHGTSEQRRQLADQLVGHVLALSLQMYGCRVIQKALEVVDVDQQTRLVSELDGHVMRCVRDQNGNHVIQKCIECVPADKIQFIISAFYCQVVILSTHPYGCRVIQRVLEHCTDEQKQTGIMEEILRATCNLAQDQYGNYVVQHVLEHGRPHERSEIITKLAGQIVQMSQHKFASNVVEKCLEFGGPAERQILINEMLGHTDENEPLQAMMKDQFANYVVQKVLETCDEQQREILLSRIRVHLHGLKKYTYGKHIVARVEKLIAAGERRSAAHLAQTLS